MTRRVRVMLLCTVLAGLVAAPAWMLRGVRREGGSESCRLLRGAATTQVAGAGNGLQFNLRNGASVVAVPPYSWFTLRGPSGILAGDVVTGLVRWMARWGPTTFGQVDDAGAHARGDGLIFFATKQGPIMGLDELSREFVVKIQLASPVKSVAWSDGVLVASVGERAIQGFSPDGAALWSADAGGTIKTGLTAGANVVCLGIDGSAALEPPGPALVALDARTGRVRWRTPVLRLPDSPPAFDGRAFYCAAGKTGSSLAAIDAANGKLNWELHDVTPSPPALASFRDTHLPAAGSGIVCVPCGNALLAFGATAGDFRWQWTAHDFQRQDEALETELGRPLIRDGVVFVACRGGARAIDCATGRELWTYVHWRASNGPLRLRAGDAVIPAPDASSPPLLAGNLLFLTYMVEGVDIVRLPGPAAVATATAVASPVDGGLVWGPAAGLAVILIAALVLRRVKAFIALVSVGMCALALWAWAASYGGRYFVGAKGFATAQFLGAGTVGRGATTVKVASESTTGISSANGSLTVGKRQVVWETSIPHPVQGDPTSLFWWTRAPVREVLAKGICLEDPPGDLGLTRFAWTRRARSSGTPLGEQSETTLTIPHWAAAALFAIAPLAWLSGIWRDRRRYPEGCCPQCGYDLRASAGICPECGTATLGAGAAVAEPSPDATRSSSARPSR